ncbi:hypothetical protein GGI12_005916, partial [Dipsacomyces acuminosporus]
MQDKHRGIWVKATTILMHLYIYIANPNAQGWESLNQVLQGVAFERERQLVRLSHLRSLVIDDICKLPSRFRLRSASEEFKYDPNKRLFILTAIIRMTWRPMLPIIILQSFSDMLHIGRNVVSGELLKCIDEPSKHEWYECYLWVFLYVVAQIVTSLDSRLRRMRAAEEDRVAEVVILELIRLPLSDSAIKNKGNYRCSEREVRDILGYMTTLYSRVSSVASGSLAVWLIYKKIGWIVMVPLCISYLISALDWCVSMLRPVDDMRSSYHERGSALIKEIYFGMKSVKFYGWERKYLDPELMNYDGIEQRRKSLYERMFLVAEFVTQILQTVSDNLSVY